MGQSSQPLQIGITGGIGSGKSVICKIFSCLGVKVYDADSRAKWLTNHDVQVRSEIIALLGEQAYNSVEEYDRKWVASQVFAQPELLTRLNSIIHPAVGRDTAAWVERNLTEKYLVKEAAIMKAAGNHNQLDYVVVVNAPVDLRIQRVKVRDNRSDNEIRAIIERQISDEERDAIADFRIWNDYEHALIPQVLELHNFFLKASKKD